MSSSSQKNNESTRRRKKLNKKITRKHPEFELTYDMMLGIRTTVSRAEASMEKQNITPQNFKERCKLFFPTKGSSYTPAHSMNSFRFKDYSPEVFKKLRKIFKIDPTTYLISLCSDFPYLEFVSNSKSGQFFFYSHDSQFMIKTQTKEECTFLMKILPHYYDHVSKNSNSLLTQFLGMHRVTRKKYRHVYFIIMKSVFYSEKYINEVYDLKGSTQGRFAKKEEKEQDVPILKDNDFEKDNVKINLGQELKKTFFIQIKKDCDFLIKQKIMDYSLVLGIHYSKEVSNRNSLSEKLLISRKQSIFAIKKNREISSPYQKQFRAKEIIVNLPEETKDGAKKNSIITNPQNDSIFNSYRGGVKSSDHSKIYFMGIIDILQEYNKRKHIEHALKSFKYDKKTISAVSPKVYAERLIKFLEKSVI